MSPDPSNAGADPSNPQSWNAYAYVLNNPETLSDPFGLAPCSWQDASGCSEEDLATLAGIGGAGCMENGVVTGCGLAFAGVHDMFDLFDIPVFTAVPVGLVTNSLTGKSLIQWGWKQIGTAAQFYGDAFAGLFDAFTGRAPANSEQGRAAQVDRLFLGMVSPEGEAEDAVTVTLGQEASISRTAAEGGREAVERALRSYRRRLAEHLSKLSEITGDPGSIEREIRNFRGLIKAAEDWLSR